jgi:hypothetical protein
MLSALHFLANLYMFIHILIKGISQCMYNCMPFHPLISLAKIQGQQQKLLSFTLRKSTALAYSLLSQVCGDATVSCSYIQWNSQFSKDGKGKKGKAVPVTDWRPRGL